MHHQFYDVVDENDNIIGKATLKDSTKRNLITRHVHVFIFNSKGELLVQRKKTGTMINPYVFTSSASNILNLGESYSQAAQRQTRDELGIVIPLNKLFKIWAEHPKLKGLVTFFVGNYDGPELNIGSFMALAEIEKLIELKPRSFSPTFIKGFKRYLDE